MNYNLNSIKNILNTEPGKELLIFLQDQAETFNKIDSLDLNWNPIHNTIELLTAKKAKQRLNTIISLLNNWSIGVKPKDPRDSYN